MERFNETIQRLKTKTGARLTVYNTETMRPIITDQSNQQIVEAYGSVEQFFEKIFADGIRKVQIRDRSANGSSTTAFGQPYTFEMQDKQPQAAPTPPPAAAEPVYQAMNMGLGFPGMQGLNFPGLSAPEMIHKTFDYARIQAENVELKARNMQLEEKTKDLERKVLTNEIHEGKTAETRKAQSDVINSIGDTVKPLIALLGERLLAPAGVAAPVTPGLAGTEISDRHQETFAILSEMDPSTVYYLGKLAEKLQDPLVAEDLLQLLRKHGIAPPQTSN